MAKDTNKKKSDKKIETEKKGVSRKILGKKAGQSEKTKKQKKEIEKFKGELSELKDKYLRIVAEFDNYKKRKDREIIRIIESANNNLFLDLLPVIDDFERSLNSDAKKKSYRSLKQGVDIIYQKLIAVLKKQGLEPIEAFDHPFDPEIHEALMQIEDKDKDSNIVLEEVQKGYRLKDRIIRHSRVVVNK